MYGSSWSMPCWAFTALSSGCCLQVAEVRGCSCVQVQQGRPRRLQRQNLIIHGMLTRQLHAVESAETLHQLPDPYELASPGTDHTIVRVQGGDRQLASQVPDLHAQHFPPFQSHASSSGLLAGGQCSPTLHCARSAGPRCTTIS